MKNKFKYIILIIIGAIIIIICYLIFFYSSKPIPSSSLATYAAPENEYRYYRGSVGDKKIHLVYWPIKDYSNDFGDNFYFVGKMVYDNENENLLDLSIRFTSGAAMDGDVTNNGVVVASFTNRTDNDRCKTDDRIRCGEWIDRQQNSKSVFIFTPSQTFKIEDFLKK